MPNESSHQIKSFNELIRVFAGQTLHVAGYVIDILFCHAAAHLTGVQRRQALVVNFFCILGKNNFVMLLLYVT